MYKNAEGRRILRSHVRQGVSKVIKPFHREARTWKHIDGKDLANYSAYSKP